MLLKPDYLTLTALAAGACIKAGDAIMEVYENADFEIEIKKDKSPVTLADKIAHNVIMSMLQQSGLPVLSEEGRDISYEERKAWDYFWLVDPLDGTKEFIKRNGEFTVNIALIKGKYPVAGVIFVPVSRELYYGVEGKGAFKINEIPKGLATEDLTALHLEQLSHKTVCSTREDPYIVVGSRSHMNEETVAYIDNLKRRYKNVELLSSGSSLKICRVAEGVANIYPRFGLTSEWDTAAGHAIVEAAGGVMVEARGHKRVEYNKKDLLNPYFIASAKKL